MQASRASDSFMSLSNQPYSKWQAIFNLEQIKERNKPTLAKQELPKAPFFLFDLDKVMAGDASALPDELLKQTFFTQAKDTENKLEKHGFQKKLRQLLREGSSHTEIIDYLKTLTPSGVELEFISLASFDFYRTKGLELEHPNELLLKMLNRFFTSISSNQDCDFV